MAPRTPQRSVWALVAAQHGIVTRGQLLALGYSPEAIKHRVTRGQLHRLWRGVYAVGRRQLTRRGRWMAAVLSCGPHAVLSPSQRRRALGVPAERRPVIEISIPAPADRRRPGIVVHRRRALASADRTIHDGIPVTTPVRTLIDMAARLTQAKLERSVNEATALALTDPDALRSALADRSGPGVAPLRDLLDRPTFALTDSDLERRFLPLARAAGLPHPKTQTLVNGFKVDFFWPELGLVIETDGLRYHRTPAQQARDRLRDQAHARAGLVALRFPHAQVRFKPAEVVATLSVVAGRLRSER